MVRLKDFKLDPSKGKVLEGRHIAGTEIAGQHRVAGEFRLKEEMFFQFPYEGEFCSLLKIFTSISIFRDFFSLASRNLHSLTRTEKNKYFFYFTDLENAIVLKFDSYLLLATWRTRCVHVFCNVVT